MLFRSYSLSAMVGVAPEDDDGNAASGGNAKGPAPRKSAYAARKDGVGFGEQQGADWATIEKFIDTADDRKLQTARARVATP